MRKIQRITVFVLLTLLTLGLSLEPVFAATYGADGDYSEWDLVNTFFADMYEDGDPSRKVESKLYLGYDGATNTAHVLVLAEPDVLIVVESQETTRGDSYVKINGNTVVDGNSTGLFTVFLPLMLRGGTTAGVGSVEDEGMIRVASDGAARFAFINERTHDGQTVADGWEASFPLAPGSYSLDVHTRVYDQSSYRPGVSAAGERSSAVANRDIPLTLASTLQPPHAAQCSNGALLWQQAIDVNNLNPHGFPNVGVRFVQGVLTSYAIPGPLPAEFADPVYVTITEAIAWDGYLVRPSTGEEPNERFKVVFLKNGSLEWASDWTGDNGDGIFAGLASDDWVGPLGGPAALPNGADQILLVHWADAAYGTGDTSNRNSVVPSSVCITYEPMPATVGDRVWEDLDGDGIQDVGEPGLSGVTTELRRCVDDGLEDSTTTDAVGNYGFTVIPGDYYVQFVAPGGYAFSPQDQGTDDAFDSDADLTTGRATCTTLNPGETDLTWDAGLIPQIMVGDRVWEDLNGDGIQDDGEPGISEVTVELYDCAGSFVAATTSDANGAYLFDGLTPGCYVVAFTPPGGYDFSPQDQGSDDALDSDADPATGQTGPINLDWGAIDLTQDAGLYRLAAVGDRVWEDLNGDGIQDDGEPGISGATIELNDCAGGFVATTTTGADGNYLFDDLEPGCYVVAFTPPGGYDFSPQDQGSDDTLDSDADTTTGLTAPIDLESGETDLTQDAGLYQLATVGDQVWEDIDGDGIQDAGEPGIPEVTIELYDCAGGLVAATTSDAEGKYAFTATPGDYYVRFVPLSGYAFTLQDEGSDDTMDSDADLASGETACMALESGEVDLTQDAGLYQWATIGDRVWEDLNKDGIQDVGEPGIAGATVRLRRCADDGLMGTTTSGADGSYSFTVAPGAYYVHFVASGGYTFSLQDQGADDVDSDANPLNGATACTTLESGETDLTWDAGLYKAATIGDQVWEDLNGDGIQDVGELGIAGVTVQLRYCTDDSLVDTKTSDASGNYGFSADPGEYYLRFLAPSGYVFSPRDQGTDDTVDSDADATGWTDCTPLESAENDPTWDAGLYRPVTIGDQVWRDLDGDGIQDDGEPGVSGVTVELYECGGNLAANTVTDADGKYDFSLVPGDYYVRFVAPSGYVFSPQGQGTDDTVDSDADPATGETGCISIESGETDVTLDAGLYQPVAIGDWVWEDVNGDGIQDGGELGVPDVTVELYDCQENRVASTTTDADGAYLFDDLVPGCYVVEFWLPSGYAFTLQDKGTDDLDSDANPVTGRTVQIQLESGEADLTQDAGLYQPATLGDLAWEDLDADGVQDVNEPGIAGVTVRLRHCADSSLVATRVTSVDGAYLFAGLAPGCYEIEFVAPLGYVYSPQDASPDDTVDSDASPATGRTAQIALQSAETDLTWDVGFYKSTALGDRVWEDLNGDGVQNGGEPGISGATVELYDCASGSVAATTSDADGAYLFEGLEPGCYVISFAAPSGYVFSPQDQGTDDTLDSDADPATGLTASIDLESGEADLTWDAGLYKPAALGDRVWEDVDGNGIQDDGEPGISGVTVELYDCADSFVGDTTTDTDGVYLFEGLEPGCYVVEFTLPGGYAFTSRNEGADDAVDSDADPATGRTAQIVLQSGQTDLTWDAGLYEPAVLGDRVWEDTNGDGIQDGGEPGISGATVELYDCAGNFVAATMASVNGTYLFDDLEPGCYVVEFVAPSGYVFSPQGAIPDDTLDSDANPATGLTAPIDLESGETDLTWDAGLYEPVTFGDRVWEDLNADGIQDDGEPGVSGVTVELYDCGGTWIATTATSADGSYALSAAPGDYYVQFVRPDGYTFSPQDVGADDVDSDADPASGQTICTTLQSGQSDLTWDAGLYRLATIGDRVWQDMDADGIQDDGEPGIAEVTVRLYRCADDSLVAPTTTDANGNYAFSVYPGDYYVQFALSGGYSFSPQDQGTDDAADSDAGDSGKTTCTTLESGENDPTWDAGMYQPAILGDRMWEDLDADGIQDDGELGISGVLVELRHCADDTLAASNTTDAYGIYAFSVDPGNYYVQFPLPGGYIFSPRDVGADDAADSDADDSGKTICTALASGEDDSTWDAGLYQLATIGDRVWEDLDADGIQDAGELGVAEVTVELRDCADDSLVDSAITDGNGSYAFSVKPGDYYVQFALPGGYTFSPRDVGADDLDSDADDSGKTICTTLESGENDPTWDAGLYRKATIGDRVWEDTNGNGIQDAGEPGVANVRVQLRRCTVGTLVDTADTDANGNYGFSVDPGDYYVRFVLSGGYAFTLKDTCADDVDSDADPTTGATACTALESGENDPTWDAGLYRTATIGDRVWEDLDADGIQDGNEPGIAEVTVELRRCVDDSLVDDADTNLNGYYSFDVAPGQYYVQFVLPDGYAFTLRDQGTDDADSDADPTTGKTICTALESDEMDLAWDAGLYRPATIGDQVWEDLDQDGIQDVGEPGLPDVPVELHRCVDDSTVDSTTTGADGSYTFTVAPGDYYVEFTAPVGYAFSPQDQGGDDALDSDAALASGKTDCTTLDPGEDDPTWDAGLYSVP